MLCQIMILLLLLYVNCLVVPDIEKNTSMMRKVCSLLLTNVNITDDDLLCR